MPKCSMYMATRKNQGSPNGRYRADNVFDALYLWKLHAYIGRNYTLDSILHYSSKPRSSAQSGKVRTSRIRVSRPG